MQQQQTRHLHRTSPQVSGLTPVTSASDCIASAEPTLLGSGSSQCMPPQSSSNPPLAQLRAESGQHSSGQLDTSGESQDPSEVGAGASEGPDAKAKLRDKNKRAQKRFRERKKAILTLHLASKSSTACWGLFVVCSRFSVCSQHER